MDPHLQEHLNRNTAIFKRSLDRIVDKYSKLKDEDNVIEVDINNTELKTLSNVVRESRSRLMKLMSKSQSRLHDQSFSSHSQLNLSSKDDGAGDNSASSSEISKNDGAEGTLKSLDESWRNSTEDEFLPEDHDEALQMSLSGRSSSLAELYPSMVSRIGRAWHRQTVSVAASSVLRRYRRWRQQPKRSLNNTFDIAAKPTEDQRETLTSKKRLRGFSGSPAKRIPCPVPSKTAGLPNGHRSPARGRGLLRGECSPLISVMNFSDAAEPKETLLNETFLVSVLSPRKQTHLSEKIPINAGSPSQRPYTPAKLSAEPSIRLKRLSVSSQSAETPSFPEWSDIYSSPVRRSPFKAGMTSTLSRSPPAFYRSPREYNRDWSRVNEPMNCGTPPLSSPTKRPVGSSLSSRPLALSPLPAQTANNQRRFRRTLSFDSSLSRPVSHSPKQVDEDFTKLFHKFVCQSKSATQSALLCRLCGRSAEAGRALSSTSLAALALSPHRSVLSKRHRDQRYESLPQSKRLRDGTYAYSPGSKRHMKEKLRRCLSQSEMEPSPGVVPYRTQSASYLEAWISRHQHHFSSLGGPRQNEALDGYSPR